VDTGTFKSIRKSKKVLSNIRHNLATALVLLNQLGEKTLVQSLLKKIRKGDLIIQEMTAAGRTEGNDKIYLSAYNLNPDYALNVDDVWDDLSDAAGLGPGKFKVVLKNKQRFESAITAFRKGSRGRRGFERLIGIGATLAHEYYHAAKQTFIGNFFKEIVGLMIYSFSEAEAFEFETERLTAWHQKFTEKFARYRSVIGVTPSLHFKAGVVERKMRILARQRRWTRVNREEQDAGIDAADRLLQSIFGAY
jgi:hypothetical protein